MGKGEGGGTSPPVSLGVSAVAVKVFVNNAGSRLYDLVSRRDGLIWLIWFVLFIALVSFRKITAL
jgi:hypothetical protein